MRGRVAVVIVALFTAGAAAQRPVPPRPGAPAVSFTRGGARLLQPSDFVWTGCYYDIATNGSNTAYGQAFTHWYVNGQLRFLTLAYAGAPTLRLDEFTLDNLACNGLRTAKTRSWVDIGSVARDGRFYGLWMEQAKRRLWSNWAIDYTTAVIPTQIWTRTLNDDGTVSNLHGPLSLAGISAKRAFGGVQPVPAWFQQKYGVGAYATGWGCYTSLVNAGGGASIGPTAYTFPDPVGYSDGTSLAAGVFQTLMDYAGAGAHRGKRATLPINYYDGGDPRQNPSTPPSVPPAPGAGWLSPAPDGTGWMVWGDCYWNTAAWIDGKQKHGLVMAASLGGDKNYYMTSTLNRQSTKYELHVFDPDELGARLTNGVPVYGPRPSSMAEIALAGMDVNSGKQGNAPTKNIMGATYDETTGIYWMAAVNYNANRLRLFPFRVNAN